MDNTLIVQDNFTDVSGVGYVDIEPRENLILVRLDKTKLKAGKIELPAEHTMFKFARADVIKVGPGGWLDSGERAPTGLNPGDRVLIKMSARQGKGGGTMDLGIEVEMNGEALHLIDSRDVLAKVKENN